MIKAFQRAIAFVLEVEGGPSNRPLADDPGGPTVFGLSRRWNQDMDPWPPTREQAIERYHDRYWGPIRGDHLPWPLSLVTFDAAVQHGTQDAIRLLQAALGVDVDGVLGARTLGAAWEADADAIADDAIARRAVYYPSLDNWQANALGWMRRLVALHREAIRQ